MNTLFTIVSLIGQAWALAANGSRRELQAGDTIRGDETLIVSAGAQVDLDFGNNRIVSFIGEQEVPVANVEGVASIEQQPVIQAITPLLDTDTQNTPQHAHVFLQEGHRFVQLVRISEILESDGMTALTVARIQEVLRPLEMVYPSDISDVDGSRESGSVGEEGQASRYPGVDLVLQGAGSDGIYNAAEIGPDGGVTVLITLDDQVRVGDLLVVKDGDGNEILNRLIIASDLTNSVTVEVPVASGQLAVNVEAIVTTPSGFVGFADDRREIDDQVPGVSVELQGDGVDGVYNLAEIGSDHSVSAQLTLDAQVSVGDMLRVTDGNNVVVLDRAVTQEDIDNGITVQVSVAVGQTSVEVTAEISDVVGNVSTSQDIRAVDNLAPEFTIIADRSDSDSDTVNLNLADYASDVNTLTYTAIGLPPGLVLNAVTGSITGTLDSSASQGGVNGVYEIMVTATDSAGAESTQSFSWTITNPVPEATADSNVTSENDPTLVVDVVGGVLSNDTDTDGDGLVVSAVNGISGEVGVAIAGSHGGVFVVNADGSYTFATNGDFDALADGEIQTTTVAYTVKDSDGSTDSTILTVTVMGTNDSPVAVNDAHVFDEDTVAIGNLLDNDTDVDSDAVLSVIDITVDGQSYPVVDGAPATVFLVGVGTLVVASNGDYRFTPASDYSGSVPVVSYTVSDGNLSDTGELALTITPVSDGISFSGLDDGALAGTDGSVTEVNLAGGSVPAGTGETLLGSFNLSAPDGISSLTIGVTVFSFAQLANAGAIPLVVDTEYGILTINGFTDTAATRIGTAVLDYEYTLTKEANHAGGEVSESISLLLTDSNSVSQAGSLAIAIVDDVPVAVNDFDEVVNIAGNPSSVATGNAVTGIDLGTADANSSDGHADTIGADDTVTPVTGVVAGVATPTANNVGQSIAGSYGTLTLNADGDYSYTPDYENAAVKGLASNASLSDTFSYEITDSDGDTDTATLVINIVGTPAILGLVDGEVTGTDGSVLESNLVGGSEESGSGEVLTGSFEVVTPNGLATLSLTGAGAQQNFTSSDLEGASASSPLTITTAHGVLLITAYDVSSGEVDYEYTLGERTDGDVIDGVTIDVLDALGDGSSSLLNIAIVDDIPVLSTDTAAITEDAPLDYVVGNVVQNDVLGMDTTGTPVSAVSFEGASGVVGVALAGQYGELTLNDDGGYRYDLNNADSNVDGLADGEVLTETFSYTVTDADGDQQTSNLTITITGSNDLPVAIGMVADPASLDDADITLDITPYFNDVDASDTLTYSVTGLPAGLTINSSTGVISGAIDHSASQGGTAGVYSIVVTATDDGGATVTQSFDWTVTNPAPVATADTNSTDENAAQLVVNAANGILNNDTDTDGDTLTVSEVNGAAANVTAAIAGTNGGVFVVNTDGSYTFTDNGDFEALAVGQTTTTQVTYTVTDSEGGTDTATLTITVTGTNDGPTAVADTGATTEDSILTVAADGVLTNDTDPDTTDTLVVTQITNVAGSGSGTGNGLFTVNPNGSYSFDPNGEFNYLAAGETETSTINYTVSDGEGGTSTASITVTITGTNDAPTAVGTITDQADADAGVVSLATSGAFTDTDLSDTLTYSATGLPAGLTINSSTGVISGTVDHSASQGGTSGVYAVVVTASDGTSTVDQSFDWTVTNPAPGAVADTGTTDEDSALTVVTANGVLSNDTDADGDTLVVSAVAGAAGNLATAVAGNGSGTGNGEFTVNGDGSYSFNPNGEFDYLAAGESETSTINYTISDGEGGTSTASITVTITGTNDAPTAVGTITDQADVDAGVVSLATSGAFADADLSNTLTYSATGLPAGLTINSSTGVISGTVDHSASQGGTAGVYNIVVTATDDANATVTQSFDWTVTNPAPEAVADTNSTDENAAQLVVNAANGILNNDTDTDGDTLTVSEVNGVAANVTAPVTGTNGGSFILNADGSYVFNDNGDFEALAVGQTATTQVTYTVTDSEGGTDTATLTITVTGTNDGPTAVADTGATTEDSILTVAADGVLTNDTDPDTTDTLVVTQITNVAGSGSGTGNGLFTVNPNGSYSFDPNGEFNYLAAGETETSTINYTVSDGEGGTSTASITVTITGTNDAPTAVGTITDQADADAGVVSLATSGAFTDTDLSDTLTYSATGLPAGLTINSSTGVISGTVDHSASQGGTSGVYAVVVTASDGTSTVDQSFDWTVTNPAPGAVADTGTTDEDSALTVVTANGVLSNDTDADGDTLVVSAVAGAAGNLATAVAGNGSGTGNGEFTVNTDGSYSFNPNGEFDYLAAGESETSTINYTISDGEGGTSTASISVTITGTNDAPTAVGTITDQADVDAGVVSLATSGAFADADLSNTLTYSATGLPAGLTINSSTGVISGTVDHSASQGGTAGVYNIVVTATDDANATVTQSFDWTVTNPAPEAVADTNSTDENAAQLVVNAANGILNNDTDTDGDTLTVSEVNSVAANVTAAIAGTNGGVFVVNTDGSYTFTDNGDFEALAVGQTTTTQVTYTVTDSEGGTDTATLTITVTGTNDGPTAVADTGATTEDSILTVAADGVLTNDTDPDTNDTLNVSEVAGAAGNLATAVAGNGSGTGNGEFTVNADGSYSFDPNGEFNYLAAGETDTSTINYTVSDGEGGTSTASITVTITGTNNAPTAVGTITDQADADAGVVSLATSGAFADADLTNTLTYSATGLPAGLTINSSTGVISGTVDNSASQGGTSGVYAVVVTASDGTSTVDQSFDWTVTNPAPGAVADTGTTDEDSALTVVTANGVLSNDTDADGDTLVVSAVAGAAGNLATAVAGNGSGTGNGEFTVNTDGSYSFNPNGEFDYLAAGESETSTINYTISDGEGGTSTASISVTITGTNDAPTAVGTITDQADVDAGVVSLATSGAFADADLSNTLTYSATGLPAGLTINSSTGVISGTVDHSASQGGTAGVYNIVVTATDDANATVTQSFDWTVTNPAPEAVADTNSTDENAAQLVVNAANGILNNDTDTDGDTLTVSEVNSVAANVTAAIAGTNGGVFVVNTDGSYTFTDNGDFEALAVGQTTTTQVTYTVTDSEGGTDTATLTITVTGTNDGPTAVADTGATTEDSILTVAADGVLTNDTDPDTNDTLNVSEVAGAAGNLATAVAGNGSGTGNGEFTVNADGSYSFDPNGEFNYLAAGETDTSTINYTVSDGEGGTSTASITVTITGTNNAPTAVGTITDQADADAGVVSLATSGAFADADLTNTLTYSATGLPAGLTINSSTGVISGTVDNSASQGGTSGVYAVVVTASDGTSTVDQSFDWTVTNPAPGAVADTGTTDEDSALTVVTANGVLSNDTDADGDTLVVSAVAGAAGNLATAVAGNGSGTGNGEFTVNTDGSYSFNPNGEFDYLAAGESETSTINYTISDGEGGTSTASISVTITGTNDAPTAVGTITDQADVDAGVVSLATSGAFADADLSNTLTYSATGLPAGLTINSSTGVISGTVDHSASQGGTAGVYNIVVTATDDANATVTQSFDWTVTNPAPEAVADTNSTDENAAQLVVNAANGILNNDTDTDGDTLTVSEVNGVAANVTAPVTGTNGGSFILNADGSYVFNDNGDFEALAVGQTATTQVTYTVTDSEGGTDTATLTITVTGTNDGPTAVADTGATTEDSILTVAADGVLTNDTDPDTTDTLVVTQITNVAGSGSGTGNGLFTVNPNGSYSFDPNGEFNYLAAGETETSTINYTVSDGEGGTSTASITVTITGTNDAPTAVGTITDQADADAGVVSLATSGAFTDTDLSDTLTYSATGLPAGLTINSSTGVISGTVDHSASQGGTSGVYAVVVTASDGTSTVDQSFDWTVTNPAPGAVADTGTTDEDSALTVVTANGVLSNDTDADGDTLVVSAVAGAAGNLATAVAGNGSGTGNGEFTVNTDGSYSFNPNGEFDYLAAGESETSTINYTISDGEGGTSTASISVTITGTNDAPTAVGTITDQADVDAGVVSLATSGAFADADLSNTLTYSATGLPAGLTINSSTGVISGTVDHSASQGGTAGVYNIVVTATDDANATVTQSFDWTVTNPAPEAVADTNSTDENAAQLVVNAANGILNNDTDTDGDTLTVSEVNGVAANVTAPVTGTNGGSFILNADGSYVFNDNGDFEALAVGQTATTQVTYTVTDSEGGTDTATLTITVTGTNDGPTAVADTGATTEDSILTVAADGVLTNDTDPDTTDTLVVTQITNAAGNGSGTGNGLFTVNPNGSYSFDPNGEFNYLAAGETETSTINYTISDGEGGTSTASITVTITGTNDAPTANNDLSITAKNAAKTFDVRTNDTDPDSTDLLSVAQINGQAISSGNSVVLAGQGSVTLNANGTLTFDPVDGFVGEVQIPYTLSDDNNLANSTDTATWTVNVIGVDIIDDASLADANVGENVLSSIDDRTDVTINGQVPASGSLTSVIISSSGGGSGVALDVSNITINADGSFTSSVNLSSLPDGTLTVTMWASDVDNQSISTTDTILQDTVTTVTADSLTVNDDDNTASLTGTGEVGSTIEISVDGVLVDTSADPVIVGADGKWSYDFSSDLSGNDSITVKATDIYGNVANDERAVPTLVIADENGGDVGDITVYEAGLASGSDATANSESASGTFTITLNDALDTVQIAGTTIARVALEAASGAPIIVTTPNGTMTITNYDVATGVVSYSYELTGLVAHDNAVGNNSFDEALEIRVTDVEGDVRIGTLHVNVVDDIPTVGASEAEVSVVEGGVTVGSATGGVNLLDNDTQGADGARVHTVTYNNASGVETTTAAIADGGSTGALTTQYGSLTVNSDGSWSYTSAATSTTTTSVDHTANGNDVQDDFSYNVIDGDGDISSTKATQAIKVTDTGPVIGTPVTNTGVDEGNLATGSDPTPEDLTVSGSLAVSKAADSIDTTFTTATKTTLEGLSLTSGTTAVEYVLSNDNHTLTAYSGAGRTDADKVFTVEIKNPTADSASYEFTLQGVLDHSATTIDLDFGFTVTDSDGDSDADNFSVTVTDDGPTAVDDSATVTSGSYVAVTGNIITTGAGEDTQGADGSTVNAVLFNPSATLVIPPTDNTSVTINGTYGVLEIKADGTYSYQRNAGTPGDVQDVFGYQITDADGDTDSATLTVSITDAGVAITDLTPQASGGDVTVNESKLGDGTGVGANSITANGTFTITSQDGVQELSLTHDGNTYNIALNNVTQALPTFTTALGSTFTVTGYNAGTGVVSYTYTLADAETHASGSGRNDLFESFTVNLTDMDNDTATDTLSVRIVDDIPVITQDTDFVAALSVDETTLAPSIGVDFSGLFSADHGADGDALTDATAYTLAANAASGLVDTATGEPVTLAVNVDGTLITASADGNVVFTIGIVNATGVITLSQQRAVEHADTADDNDAVSIITSAVSIIATATDGDDDVVTSTIEIGDRFTFLDDGPSITTATTGPTGLATITTTDSDLPGSSTANQNFAGAFSVDTSSYGADGDAGTVWDYALGLANATSGLKSNEEDITLSQSGDTITGTANGSTVFTIVVSSATGVVTLTQLLPIDHTTDQTNLADFSADTQSLLANLITLTGTATITDGDGDTASDSQTINIGDKFIFEDDGPTIGTPDNASVDEADLASGSSPTPLALTQTGGLDIALSGDGVNTQFAATSVADFLALGLTSNNVALSYSLSGDGHTLTAVAGAVTVFTATITNPTAANAGYSYVLSAPIDHSVNGGSQDLEFEFIVTDGDGDTATSSFTVAVTDDAQLAAQSISVDEDSLVTFNTSSDANDTNTTIFENGAHGLASVNSDGTVTYTPNGNYSGEDSFTYRTVEGGVTTDTVVTVTVAPFSDVPTLTVDTASISTDEDTAIELGLIAPVAADVSDANGITDAGDASTSGDNPELLGLITLSGVPDGAVLSSAIDGANPAINHAADGGDITVYISDGTHIDGVATGADITLTTAQFEALQVLPSANSDSNFTVTASVTSYEVDDSGTPIAAAGSETTTAEVLVYVQAVTDDAELLFNDAVAGTVDNVDAVSYNVADTVADVTIKEDTTFTLNDILSSSFADLDGSEVRSITIQNTTGETILVDGTALAAGASRTIDAKTDTAGQTGDIASFDDISIGADEGFSGDLEGISITINAQDKDADGYNIGNAGNTVDGVAEVDTSNNQVTLNLYVTPVAGDVELTANDITTPEDTAVAFLKNISVTDTGTTAGTEVITKVAFDVPTDWVMNDSAVVNDAAWTTDLTGTTYTIEFTAGTELEREAVLDGFTITPSAHSSLDQDITVTVTTQDSNTVNGPFVSDTTDTDLTIKVEITPVAERSDSDTADPSGNDVSLVGHSYTTTGEEDSWFNLGTEGTSGDAGYFSLADGWSNEDSSETTFARLTPNLVTGDGSNADANGASFRYSTDGGSTWVTQTYTGSAIDVPIEYLDTLQFKAASNFSGSFSIDAVAVTRDYDEDAPNGDYVEAVSGAVSLTNVLVLPVADTFTTTVTANARGTEDLDIPLMIHPSSSDASETFNVTISSIPDGAAITYDGNVYTIDTDVSALDDFTIVTAADGSWSIKIEGFDPALGDAMTIKAPLNSNDVFTLDIDTDSVDTLVIDGDINSPYESINQGATLQTIVSPKGDADSVILTLNADPTYTETAVDSTGFIMLNTLITGAVLSDNDGSEELSFAITDLPDGFSIVGGNLISEGYWSITEAQSQDVKLITPANYNGDVDFTLYTISTENDGDSLTEAHNLSLTITASPEAVINLAAVVDEDESTALNFAIQHQNNDTDEVLDAVWIKVSSLDAASDLTLTYGENGPEIADGQTGVTLYNDGTDDWYILEGAALTNIYAQGDTNVSGTNSFDIKYFITDPGLNNGADVQESTDSTYTVTINPVTDTPTLSVTQSDADNTDGVLDNGTNVIAIGNDSPLEFSVDLNIGNTDGNGGNDYDGSEKLIRVVVDGVPDGVLVEDADYLGDNQWLMHLDANNSINGSFINSVNFIVSAGASSISETDVTFTVITEDDGNGSELSASQIIKFSTDFDVAPGGNGAADIDQWTATDFNPTEDTAFMLSEAITAQIDTVIDDADGTGTVDVESESAFTITLTDVSEGTVIEGMASSFIDYDGDGTVEEVWTLSGTGGNSALDAAMDSISIKPPANYNENSSDSFSYTATLTTTNTSTSATKQQTEVVRDVADPVNVVPVTDDADIDITVPTVDEGNDLTFTINLSNSADDPNWTLIDGKLYVQLDESDMPTGGGTLSDGVGTISTTSVTGISGVPDGDYYVITGVDAGTPFDLVYTPAANGEHYSGSVSLAVTAQGQEVGASNTSTTTTVVAGEITPINSGYDFTVADTVGNENNKSLAAADRSNVIQLAITDNGLFDTDSSESISSVLLKGLPNDFLVYVGTSAANAELATNTGYDSATATNNWLLSTSEVPAYVGIMAPAYWSGTLDDLTMVVSAVEDELTNALATEVDFTLTVEAVANGITLTPTSSFGTEGDIIPINLNIVMNDAQNVGNDDSSVEAVNLQFTGLGAFAEFYVDGVSISTGVDSNVSYDSNTDTYTITELSEDQAGDLGIIQSANAIGTVQVRAQTEEVDVSDGTVTDTSDWTDFADVTVDISNQLATSGSDTLLYNGASINGLAGDDIIQLRFGEDLDFAAGADGQLSNIETIDLGDSDYDHNISNLSLADIQAMTDDDNILTIDGSAGDNVTLLKDNDPLTSGWVLDDSSDSNYDIYTLTDENSIDTVVKIGKDITTEVAAYEPTTGDDTFVYDGSAIDGLAGEDTIQLRLGEEVTGANIGNLLSNVETIDLSVSGSNKITSLSASDVLDATDGDHTLRIDGDANDSLSLDVASSWVLDTGAGVTGYDVYTATASSETVILEVANGVVIE
nr:Ig-like domain-containing protein [uncultured Amphritea sp.]